MQRKKEMIESDVLTSNDIATMMAKTQSDSSPTKKIIYSNEKIEISFDF